MSETNGITKRKKNILERILLLTPISDGTVEEALLIWLTVSVWLHYVVSGAMMVLLLAAVLIIPEIRKKTLREKKMFFLGVIIAVFSLLSSCIAKNLIGMAISFGIFLIITLGAFAKSVMTEIRFQKISVISCVGSVVYVFVALYQNFIKYGDNPLYRPTAGAFNANYYGALIVMTLIICIYNVLDIKKPVEKRMWYYPYKLIFIAVFLLNCVALLVCESRSALLAFLVCTVFYLFITRRYLLFAVAVSLAVGVGAIGWFYPEVMSWTNSLAASITERSTIWKEALKSFSQNPYTALFGRGPMTYYHVMEKEGLFVANHAHNIIVDTLINVGIIGTAAYSLLIAYFVKEIFGARGKGNKAAFAVGFVFLVEIFAQGIADVTVMWHQSALLFVMMFAVVGSETNRKNDL